mgnify:FL=1
MRKILISVLLILVLVLAFFTIFQGISIGTFEILSAEGIIALNDDLSSEIETANRKIKSDLQTEKANLSESINNLLQSKERYYDLANVSTESEINEANTEETYEIEYLWLRVGRHARTEGVNIRMDVINGNNSDASVKDLSFTVVGQYEGIIEFVSALEEDSELSFRIDNFNLLPSGTNLQATFSVSGVRINLNNMTQTNTTTSTGTTATDTTADTTTTTQGSQTSTTADTNAAS